MPRAFLVKRFGSSKEENEEVNNNDGECQLILLLESREHSSSHETLRFLFPIDFAIPVCRNSSCSVAATLSAAIFIIYSSHMYIYK